MRSNEHRSFRSKDQHNLSSSAFFNQEERAGFFSNFEANQPTFFQKKQQKPQPYNHPSIQTALSIYQPGNEYEQESPLPAQVHLRTHQPLIYRKKGGGEDTAPEDIPEVGIQGGESKTPSDQAEMASGYEKQEDETYNTPDGRNISEEQALAESQVIKSAGIFMGAYLARYNLVKTKYGLDETQMGILSSKAGFLKQFKTGDIVLRMMAASDSEGLATVTESNYSHSGIIHVSGGRVMVLDSYPGRSTEALGGKEDSTILISFEEFFSDHHGEKVVRGLVLRVKNLSEEIRGHIDDLIRFYDSKETTFDHDFQVDNDEFSLYCSELVWRILKEAGSPVLPQNEYDFTKKTVEGLIAQLEAGIQIQKSQGEDTTELEEKLAKLKSMLEQFESVTTEELYSPGSLERTGGLESVSGFTREGKIQGLFLVKIVRGTVPSDSWDTPDAYVSVEGKPTSVKEDTTSPVWNEQMGEFEYDELQALDLTIYDKDPISFDDVLASFSADVRPVRPKGQTFYLESNEASLEVFVKGKKDGKNEGAFGPQTPRSQ